MTLSLSSFSSWGVSHWSPTWRAQGKGGQDNNVIASSSNLEMSARQLLSQSQVSAMAWSTEYLASCCTTSSFWMQAIASLEISAHGLSGYINWALRIWSSMSTSCPRDRSQYLTLGKRKHQIAKSCLIVTR